MGLRTSNAVKIVTIREVAGVRNMEGISQKMLPLGTAALLLVHAGAAFDLSCFHCYIVTQTDKQVYASHPAGITQDTCKVTSNSSTMESCPNVDAYNAHVCSYIDTKYAQTNVTGGGTAAHVLYRGCLPVVNFSTVGYCGSSMSEEQRTYVGRRLRTIIQEDATSCICGTDRCDNALCNGLFINDSCFPLWALILIGVFGGIIFLILSPCLLRNWIKSKIKGAGQNMMGGGGMGGMGAMAGMGAQMAGMGGPMAGMGSPMASMGGPMAGMGSQMAGMGGGMGSPMAGMAMAGMAEPVPAAGGQQSMF